MSTPPMLPTARLTASSLNALIGPEEVRAAMVRYWRPFQISAVPKMLGVDVARFGDDRSIICCRQGVQVFEFKTYRNLDSTQGASEVTRAWNAFDADACFVDNTGGFGSGWLDQLRVLGRSPVAVSFAGKAHEHGRFKNKRAEMYFAACDWIRAGIADDVDRHNPGDSTVSPMASFALSPHRREDHLSLSFSMSTTSGERTLRNTSRNCGNVDLTHSRRFRRTAAICVRWNRVKRLGLELPLSMSNEISPLADRRALRDEVFRTWQAVTAALAPAGISGLSRR
jgi:hypothetical protein